MACGGDGCSSYRCLRGRPEVTKLPSGQAESVSLEGKQADEITRGRWAGGLTDGGAFLYGTLIVQAAGGASAAAVAEDAWLVHSAARLKNTV